MKSEPRVLGRWWPVALLLAACARSDDRWLADLDHADPFVRTVAAIALGQEGPELGAPAVPVLLESIDRPGLGLREQAEVALVHIGPFAGEALVQSLLEDERMSAERRQAVMRALVAGGPRSVPAITAALAGPEHSSASDLGEVLVRIGAPSVAPLAELFERDPRPQLRSYVAWLLGRLGPRAGAAVPVLQGALSTANAQLRADIEAALARISAR